MNLRFKEVREEVELVRLIKRSKSDEILFFV